MVLETRYKLLSVHNAHLRHDALSASSAVLMPVERDATMRSRSLSLKTDKLAATLALLLTDTLESFHFITLVLSSASMTVTLHVGALLSSRGFTFFESASRLVPHLTATLSHDSISTNLAPSAFFGYSKSLTSLEAMRLKSTSERSVESAFSASLTGLHCSR